MNKVGWTPPSKQHCIEALIGCNNFVKKGYKATFSERHRRFHDSAFFQPITIASEADWLVNHDEAGQTYESFWRTHVVVGGIKPSGRPRTANPVSKSPSNGKKIIYIQPLGHFPCSDIEGDNTFMIWLKSYCEAFFHTAVVRILAAISIADIKCKFRVNALTGKFQLNAANVNNYLKKIKPNDAHCVIGVTMVDLFPKSSWDFVFGLASSDGGVGVFSFARYEDTFYETWTQGNDVIKTNPDGSLDYSAFDVSPFQADGDHVTGKLLLRACKVMCHEVCHTFGMDHCIYNACIMNGSNHLQESDRRPAFLCPVCLRKLQAVLEFELIDRYKAMEVWSTTSFWNNYSHQKYKPSKPTKIDPTWSRRTSLPDVIRKSTTSSRGNGLVRPVTSKSRLTSTKANPVSKPADFAKSVGIKVPAPPLDDFEQYRDWLCDVIKYL